MHPETSPLQSHHEMEPPAIPPSWEAPAKKPGVGFFAKIWNALHGTSSPKQQETEQHDELPKPAGYLRTHRLAFLGDYLDRGPDVRGLIELCVTLQREGHVFIAGNHEYTLRMALTVHPDRDAWIERWAERYEWNTLASYGVSRPHSRSEWRAAGDALVRRMPPEHRRFIASLPHYHEDDRHILVHAGLEVNQPWEEQRTLLQRRGPIGARGPSQLFSCTLATAFEHRAPKTVVSGHAMYAQPYATDRRILLNCGVEFGGSLAVWISDENRYLAFPNLTKTKN